MLLGSYSQGRSDPCKESNRCTVQSSREDEGRKEGDVASMDPKVFVSHASEDKDRF